MLKPACCGASGCCMSVDKETVQKIARLSRIAISDEEADAMVPELNSILDWVEQLSQVDVSGVEPTTAVIPNTLRLREDKVSDGDVRDKILQNAPAREDVFFGVPKVIE